MDSLVKPITFVNRKGLKLFGIIHTPPQPRRDVGIIILSPGIKNRVAPHRLYVKMAKRFCEMGFCVLRFDPQGIGDSEGEIEERMAANFYASVQVGRFVSDTIDAMDWMEREYGISSFILTGLCGGAITGLLAGAMDQRVCSLLGLGIPVILDSASTDQAKYMTRGQLEKLRDGYLRKLLNIKSWARFLSMKSDYRLIYKSTLRLPGLKAWACSGLTLSRAFLLRLKRRDLASTRDFGESFDPESLKTEGLSRVAQAEGALPNGSILTVVKGKTARSHTAHTLPRRERDGVRVKSNESDNNFNPYFPAALHNMLSSRKVLLIFSEADRLYWEFEEKYMPLYKNEFEKYKKNIEIFIAKDANHIFSFKTWQDEMLNTSCAWLSKLLPAEAGSFEYRAKALFKKNS